MSLSYRVVAPCLRKAVYTLEIALSDVFVSLRGCGSLQVSTWILKRDYDSKTRAKIYIRCACGISICAENKAMLKHGKQHGRGGIKQA